MNSENLALVTALRRELHANPEPSGREERTKERLQNFLYTHARLEIVDCGRWFYARKKGDGSRPPVAFRAEMDALPMDEHIELPWGSTRPGVSHKCGHDGHCAVIAGLALEVESLAPDRDIYFIFQHAEETGQGGRECAPLLPRLGVDEVFAFHNMAGGEHGSIGIRNGTMNCASQGMALHFTGVPSHASLPEAGKNPALAVADLLRAIPKVAGAAEYQGPVWCTVVQVDVGSANFGISAGQGSVLLTCRGEREADMQALSNELAQLAEDFARRDGLGLEVSYHDVFPETSNHAESADKVRAAASALGYDLHEMAEPMRASEDVGHFFKTAKGALWLMYVGDRPPIHAPEYDFDDSIIEPAVELFKALIDY